jgi:DNA invertase Pin-like site-specific DNA recombinase/DNA-binding NarL/FixJ family response regulator
MPSSELITPAHLSRQAIIYIRQSSPNQVLTHQESTRLQYALRQRALDCGWSPDSIEVIDADQGLTAEVAEGRAGFKEIAARVTLGQVGILFSYDVTRLSRNLSDWFPLLDLCGYRHCLIGDRDGIYDAATPNGRLLLGMKGQLAEMELHTLRGRLTAGLLNKAGRGELAQRLPAGLVRDALGRVVKHPDREVRDAIDLVFATFLRIRTISGVVRCLRDQGLSIPRRGEFGDVVWRAPTVRSLASLLANPAYAGAFVYGRTRAEKPGPNQPAVQKSLPRDEWRICVPDKYPAYIDWATYERIRAMIRDNYSEYERKQNRGVPRPGKALLHGLVYCGECGRKMSVQYKSTPQYICNSLHQIHRVPACQRIGSDAIDERVVELFFAALAPAELDVYDQVLASLSGEREQLERAREQQIERMRYEARLAERQYQQSDPDNRLVTAELERRWEMALRELKRTEEGWVRERQQQPTLDDLDAETREALRAAGRQVPELWRAERFSQEQKKALLRCLIDKVVLRRSAPDVIACRVVWRGGDTTDTSITVTVGSLKRRARGQEMEQAILTLAGQGKSDEEIARRLTLDGHRSPRHTTVLPSTVQYIRLRHHLFTNNRQSHPRTVTGFLTVPQVAEKLKIERDWIYHRIHIGTIEVTRDPARQLYLFPDTAETVRRFRQLVAGKVQHLRF